MFKYNKQLRSFHAVAREGGFTAAADYLSIGQPTVTEQVSDLEQRFGVELFFRRGRTVELTSVGQQLHAVTQGMFNHEEEAMQLLRNLRSHQTGIVRIGAVSPPIGIELLSCVGKNFPKLKVDLSLSNEEETVGHLLDFKVDIADLALKSQDPRLHLVPYQSHSIVAVMRHDHPLANKSNISLEELAAESLILREFSSKTRQIVEQAAIKNGIKLKPKFEINSREAIIHAVRAGMGMSFVTEIEYMALPDLRAVPIKKGKLQIDYFLCCLDARRTRPIIASILGLTQTTIPAN